MPPGSHTLSQGDDDSRALATRADSSDSPLRLRAPGAPPLAVPVVRAPSAKRRVRVWDDKTLGVDQGDAAAAWLAAVLGIRGARLVRKADDEQRLCDRKCAPSRRRTLLVHPALRPLPISQPTATTARKMRRTNPSLRAHLREWHAKQGPICCRYAPRGQHTAFSDGFPLLLASEVAALNKIDPP